MMLLYRQGAYVTSRQPTGKRRPTRYGVAVIGSSDLSLRKSERTLDLNRHTPSPPLGVPMVVGGRQKAGGDKRRYTVDCKQCQMHKSAVKNRWMLRFLVSQNR
jgi:hypothetical protein